MSFPSHGDAIRFSRSSVVLDSNLLLLLVIGLWEPREIARQRRLSHFDARDFVLLRDFLGQFKKVVTTPHVLTEVSNLAAASSGHNKTAIFHQLSLLIGTLDERAVSAAAVCKDREYLVFGLTDAVLSQLCSEMLLLTEDGRLANHLQRKGHTVMSLKNIQALRHAANLA